MKQIYFYLNIAINAIPGTLFPEEHVLLHNSFLLYPF